MPELNEPVVLTVTTKCPGKWKLTDLETGEVYTAYPTEGKLQWKKDESSTI
jgi:hypothetical protein